MFVTDEIAFVELHKTGCTHIAKLLSTLYGGEQRGKHNRPLPIVRDSGRMLLASVRNPWDWYVSLWSYGCGHEGLVHKLTTESLTPDEVKTSSGKNSSVRKPEVWKRCYADVSDASAFRDWLHMMNDKNYWNDFGEGYGGSIIASMAGILTYRYIELFCHHVPATLNNIDDLKSYAAKHCYIDHFIRTEHLEGDFVLAIESSGNKLSASQKDMIYSAKKTNVSSGRKDTSYYYDDETRELVRRRESLVIDKFYPSDNLF